MFYSDAAPDVTYGEMGRTAARLSARPLPPAVLAAAPGSVDASGATAPTTSVVMRMAEMLPV